METANTQIPLVNTGVQEETRKFHPVKFTVWLLMVASGMLFMGFTSALIVSKSDGVKNDAWMQYDIPVWFTVSTAIVVLSSVLIHLAYKANLKGNQKAVLAFMALTILGGLAFITSQYLGYKELVKAGVYLSNESAAQISGSFFYVITGGHLFHIVLGLLILLYTIIQVFRGKVNSSKSIMMYVSTFYWHFLGFLWIYLFLLLNLTR